MSLLKNVIDDEIKTLQDFKVSIKKAGKMKEFEEQCFTDIDSKISLLKKVYIRIVKELKGEFLS